MSTRVMPPSTLKPPVLNRLLSGLPLPLRERMLQDAELIELEFGTILCEPQETFEYVYFPLVGFISWVVVVDEHQPLEMGLIGREGMLGATLALGVAKAPMRALVQGSGAALRMSAVNLQKELQRSPALVAVLNHYAYVLLAQLATMTACIHFHAIEPRLARWLLMTQDCAQTHRLHLTQEFLAAMLGVRRSGVTVAAGSLQAKKLIHYSRGEIMILNRKGLEAAACTCYKTVLRDYEQVFGL